jgi:hypothetical protein
MAAFRAGVSSGVLETRCSLPQAACPRIDSRRVGRLLPERAWVVTTCAKRRANDPCGCRRCQVTHKETGWLVGALVLALVASGCQGGAIADMSPAATFTPLSTASLVPAATSVPSPFPSDIRPTASAAPNAMDVLGFPNLAEIEPGTYSIHPGIGGAGTLRVLFTVPAEGWRRFLGAYKETGDGRDRVAVNFFDVKNIVTHACEDHSPADPPVGPTVDDLAAAAAALEPFELRSPPSDVEAYGYRGKHLEIVVPEIPHSNGAFTECQGAELQSWIAPRINPAFYGYNAPGLVEELWILDVEGRRLMIQAMVGPDARAADIAEMRSLLESIHIQP